jgi:cation diffusion facilitator family transporter
VANVLIAIAKLGAGFLSGSSAMLAEGAHSIADTMNEVFLLIGLRLEKTPADEEHPYGYGKDRFLWSFLAAVFIFFAGGLFSVYNGAHAIMHPGEEDTSFVISYIVLGASFLFESGSLLVSVRQFRKAMKAEGDTFLHAFKTTADTSIKVPMLEDSAALIGLALAGAGLALAEFTGNHIFDGLASIGIGLLLLVVAWGIGNNSRDLLLGAALPQEDRRQIREIILSFPEVTSIYRLLTMRIGAKSALITAELHLIDGLDTDQIEQLLGRIEQAIRQRIPEATQIFLEVHPGERPAETGMQRAGAPG